MSTNPVAVPETISPPHQLACLETWGGNRVGAQAVTLPGLDAWVSSVPHGDTGAGGDLHYLSVCNSGLVSRVAVADVTGHGETVSELSTRLHKLMRQYINHWDQADLMRDLNDAFGLADLDGRFATAVVLGYYREEGLMAFTNAGHPPPLWYRSATGRWEWLEEAEPTLGQLHGLPVGLIPGTSYRQTLVAIEPGDMLVLYTDGVTEARGRDGEMLGQSGLRDWVSSLEVVQPQALGEALVAKLQNYRAGEPDDDETVIVLQRPVE